jgi:hypothetical protein
VAATNKDENGPDVTVLGSARFVIFIFLVPKNVVSSWNCEISSSHGGEYDVQSCLLGYTAV